MDAFDGESTAYRPIVRLRTNNLHGDVALVEGVGPEHEHLSRRDTVGVSAEQYRLSAELSAGATPATTEAG